jgi:hypothetical protein
MNIKITLNYFKFLKKNTLNNKKIRIIDKRETKKN